MKKPYLPLIEFPLGRWSNFSNNKAIELDKSYLEYIRKYFPSFNSRINKSNVKHHEIDDPMIDQHKVNSTAASKNSSVVDSKLINNKKILSINGITIAANRQTQQSNSLTTFRPPTNVTASPPTNNAVGCPVDQPFGTWSGWVISEKCTADCGSCGRQTKTRQCLSYNGKTGSGCPCMGEYKQLESCNIGVCQFPKPSCCPPYNLMFIQGFFACGPHNETIIQIFLQQASNG